MAAAGQAAQQAGNQATQATNQAAAATNNWRKGLEALRRNARLFGADIVGRLTAAYGALALFDRMVNETAKSFERMTEISKNSQKAGLGAEDYQKVSRVAQDTGASIDEAASALGRYIKMIKDAAAGNEEARQTLLALGYTEAQVQRGQINSIDILARLSARYRSATSEAERLSIIEATGVPKQVLEAGPAAVAMAGSARTQSASSVESRAAEQEVAGRPGGFFASLGSSLYDLFVSETDARSSKIMGAAFDIKGRSESAQFAAAAGAGNAIDPNMDAHGIRALQEALKNTNLTDEQRGGLEARLKEAFAAFADDFRVTFAGTTQGGVVQSREMIEAELQRKFVEMFPQYATPAAGSVAAEATKPSKAEVASGVSSLQSIGGGGGFFQGAVEMVTLATRTADASERTATAVEALANRGGSPTRSGATVSAD